MELGRLALDGSSLEGLAHPVGQALREALGVAAVALVVRDDLGLSMLGGVGWGEIELPAALPRELTPLLDRALSEGSTQRCDDLPGELGQRSFLGSGGFVSLVAVPLAGLQENIGVLAVLDRSARSYAPAELRFLQAVARILGDADRRRRAEAALVERVKEQTAIAAVARLVQRHPPRDEVLSGAVQALLPALQHPEMTGAHVDIDGATASAGPSDLAVELRVPIMVSGERRGHVKVGYTEDRPFLDEERTLLRTVAESVASWIVTADANDARRATEDRFRALVERASDVLAIVDTDFTVRFISPPAERLTGLRPTEIIGSPVTDFLADADLDALEDHWRDVLATDEPVGPLVHRVRHRDGSWRYVEVVHTNRIEDPAVRGVIANLRDVTERVAVERALSESEARFRRLAENAPDVIYRLALEPKPHFEYVSPAVERVLGYPPEHFYRDPRHGQDMLVRPEESILRIDPDDLDQPLTDVVEMQHRDGTTRWIERRAVVVRDRTGRPIAIEAVERDVTEARRADEALRRSEARLSRVLETMAEGLLMFDPSGIATYANRAAEEIFEVEPGGLVGRHHTDEDWGLTGPEGERLGGEHRVVHRVLEHREPVEGVVLGRRRSDGTRIAWETNVSPVRDDANAFMGIILSMRDVTERLEADRAVREALRREREASEHLRQVDEMKTGFLQAVSHELRTPLTSLLGFSVLLRRHGELPEAQVDLLVERLAANAEKLDRLLADLLDVDRLGRGTLEARRSRTDADVLIRRVVSEIDGPTERVRVLDRGAIATIDGPRTERIVENLVLNALRHTDGPVDVTAETTDGDGLVLTVADRGDGVPDDLKPSLFEPFQQGDTEAARVGGAGIGLTVVRTFAELHGGRAWIEDRPGGGSRFRVLLPGAGGPGTGGSPVATT